MAEHEATLTIPVTITVRIGEGAVAALAGTPAVGVATEAAHAVSFFEGRKGYDPAFLGVAIPLPQLSAEQRRNAAKNSSAGRGEDPVVLPYTHFSVVMNRRRQIAYFTAVNIDGRQSVALERSGDRWFLDARIAESEQIGEALYKRNALDRGHLVRRLDPVWGPESARAKDDTFHFTNCSPQHERFNQGQDRWQGLENYILDRADAADRRVTVFTGPVLDEDDPLYRGIRLPLAFWKIIAYVKTGGQLATAAYVLEQGGLIRDLPGLEAAFDPGTFRVTLAHLKERTGLDFDYLATGELPLSSDGLEASRERVAIREDFSNVSL